MADTYTTRNRVIKPEPGQYTNTWGTVLNGKAFDLFDAAMDGVESYTLSGTKTLTSVNADTDQARMRVQNITGGTGGTVTIPAVQKMYLVRNNASGTVYFTAGGTMATIPAGSTMMVFCDGTDCYTQTPIEYAAAADVNYYGTTTESETIGTGAKTLTIEADKLFFADQYVVMSAGGGNYMWGQVTSYNIDTGAMVFNSIQAFGSGTFTSWEIGVSGPVGPTGSPYPSIGSNGYKVLAVNSAGTDIEWIDPRWVQIATASPSAASEQAFTSLKNAAYSDLLIIASLTPSTTAITRMQISADGSTYSSNNSISDSTANLSLLTVQINGYRFSSGNYIQGKLQPASFASPGQNGAVGAVTPWGVTGGIDAIKFNQSTGTMTGTITIYGRR